MNTAVSAGMRRLAILVAPPVLLLAAIALGAAWWGTDPARFTRDPAAWHESDPLIGGVSNLGVLIWMAAAAISLFSAALLRQAAARPDRHRLLLHAGLLTLWLALDDLFMIHERLAPDALGIPQRVVLAAYGVWLAVLLWRFRRAASEAAGPTLLAALGFLVSSVLIDQLAPGHWFEWRYLMLIEDGTKLLGIVSWCAWLISIARSALVAAAA